MTLSATSELLRGQGPDLGPFATRFPLPERTLLHLLAAQADSLADKDWLVFDGTDRLTFRQAQEAVNQFAHALLEEIDEPCHVALFLRNQSEFLPVFYGAMAAGGCTVPLNADSRGRLLQAAIERSDARVLVARSDLVERLVALDSLGSVELVLVVGAAGASLPEQLHGARVKAYEPWIADRPTTPPRPLPDSSEVCLIQFTSGTTGNSKGVVYPHHFLYLYSAAIADRMEHGTDDVLFSPMPLYHVAALHLIANAALHAGCVAHLRSRFSARRFWDQVAQSGATHTVILGPMAQIILKVVPEAPEHRMRLIYCVPFPPGGEEFQTRYRVKLVWQGFGMTEVYTNAYFDHEHDGVRRDRLGHPFSWIEYGVVDEHDRMVGPGEVGQLVFRPTLPDAMAREYYKEPAATVKAFRNFMFHTGDLAWRDEEGALYFRGREQDRIRRRGENVSATELEGIVQEHPAVLEAAAYGVPGSSASTRSRSTSCLVATSSSSTLSMAGSSSGYRASWSRAIWRPARASRRPQASGSRSTVSRPVRSTGPRCACSRRPGANDPGSGLGEPAEIRERPLAAVSDLEQANLVRVDDLVEQATRLGRHRLDSRHRVLVAERKPASVERGAQIRVRLKRSKERALACARERDLCLFGDDRRNAHAGAPLPVELLPGPGDELDLRTRNRRECPAR